MPCRGRGADTSFRFFPWRVPPRSERWLYGEELCRQWTPSAELLQPAACAVANPRHNIRTCKKSGNEIAPVHAQQREKRRDGERADQQAHHSERADPADEGEEHHRTAHLEAALDEEGLDDVVDEPDDHDAPERQKKPHVGM